MTVWSLLEECVSDLDDPIYRSDIVRWFREKHPEINERTLGVHIQGTTETDSGASRGQFAGRPALLRRTARGVYVKAVGGRPNVLAVPTVSTPVGAAPRSADLLLVGCVKTKLSRPAPAADLFVSPLFVARRRYAERQGVPWYILSAKCGLLAPDDVVGPYDVYLADQSADYRAAWGRFVVAQLVRLEGDIRGRVVEVHAGSSYVEPLRSGLAATGAELVAPLAGLRQGEHLPWYGGAEAATAPVEHDGPSAPDDVDALIAVLADGTRARPSSDFVADGRARWNQPGLYSWWVDRTGSEDLSAGLGFAVPAGLIYAGQAGATRWPSGRASSNTLWLRITGMHLGGRAKFSTFRRTLSAALRTPLSLVGEDDPRLTVWMDDHLRVTAVAVPDPDRLGRLEDGVLDRLDPPLNIRGRPTTPLRRRLSELRVARGD